MPRTLLPNKRIEWRASFGDIPDWKTFKHNFHAPDEEGRTIDFYEMKLVSGDAIPRVIDEGYHSFTDRELYALVKKLMRAFWNNAPVSGERAGDLAQAIMGTLGFEWV